jgi:hypothetical protein
METVLLQNSFKIGGYGMKRFFLFFLFLIFAVSVSATTTVQLVSDNLNDVYVDEGLPNRNRDNEEKIRLHNFTPAGNKEGLIMFNISLYSSENFSDAKLCFYLTAFSNDLDSSGERFNVSVHHLYNHSYFWNETNVTWSLKPTREEDYRTDSTDWIEFNNTCQGWYCFDVTDSVNNETKENISFYLETHDKVGSPGISDYIGFETKESSNTSARPYLNLTYVSESPTVTLSNPTDGLELFFKDRPFVFNFSVSADYNVKNASLYGNWSGTWQLNQSNTSEVYVNGSIYNFSAINITRNHSYKWNVEVCLTNDNCSFASSNRTFNVSNTIPAIPTQTYPDDLKVISTDTTWVNFTTTDDDDDTIRYHVYADTNADPTTLAYNGTNKFFNFTGLGDGNTYYWKVQADDTFKNSSNSSIRSFGVSTSSPAITIHSPTNNSWNTSDTSILFSFTAIDPNVVDYCSLYINSTGWHKNQTINVTSGVKTNFSLLALEEETSYFYNIWCNDSAGAEGYYSFGNTTFGIDTIKPNLTTTSPTETTYTSRTISIEYSANDTLYKNCTYNIYQGTFFPTGSSETGGNVSCNSSFTVSVFTSYVFNMYAEDMAGNINATQINFSTQSPATGGGTIQGGGGGGGATVIEKIISEVGNFSMETDSGSGSYDIIVIRGSQLKKKVCMTNLGPENITLMLSCQSINGICDWVNLSESNVSLPPNELIMDCVDVLISVPDTVEFDEVFEFSIIASRTDIDAKAALGFRLTVGKITGYILEAGRKLFKTWFVIPLTKWFPERDFKDINIPNYVFVIPLSVLTPLLLSWILKREKFRYLALPFIIIFGSAAYIVYFIIEFVKRLMNTEKPRFKERFWKFTSNLNMTIVPLGLAIISIIII